MACLLTTELLLALRFKSLQIAPDSNVCFEEDRMWRKKVLIGTRRWRRECEVRKHFNRDQTLAQTQFETFKIVASTKSLPILRRESHAMELMLVGTLALNASCGNIFNEVDNEVLRITS